MSRPLIALCMIVRDASRTIDALLASVKGSFDEYVFVDTGSVDDTREKIAAFFGLSSEAFDVFDEGGRCYAFAHRVNGGALVRLATFQWIDDFAAARNFAFGLASARWRGYLDADDTFPTSSYLRAWVAKMEEQSPDVNCIAMPYVYKATLSEQDTLRFVRWDDGWSWEGAVHEALRSSDGRRKMSLAKAFVVHHDKTPDEEHKSGERNIRIIQKRYAETRGDPETGPMWAYHYAQAAQVCGEFSLARELLIECLDGLSTTNIGYIARQALVEIAIDRGDLDEALHFALQALAFNQERAEALWMLGMVHTLRKEFTQAVASFDTARQTERMPVRTSRDPWFEDGYVKVQAALAYVTVDRNNDAKQMLNEIPEPLRHNPNVRDLFVEVNARVMERDGLHAVTSLVDFLIWDTEPTKAMRLLDECVPAAVAHRPEIAAAKRFLQKKLVHLQSWEDYKACYAAIPESVYHTDTHHRAQVLDHDRVKTLLDWARTARPNNRAGVISVCAIGFQDGIIEDALLAENEHIHLTVCDVAPQASKGLKELQEKWPGRVTSRPIVNDHYDWFRFGEQPFDAVTIFEVIEHLPSDKHAFSVLRNMLRADGKLFLSTPVARYWVEPYLTDAKLAPAWYGHVRAHNHVSLWRLLRLYGFNGELREGNDCTFVANMTAGPILYEPNDKVSIFVPSTPTPFGPHSAGTGFLGGSEECVIHLAEHLAKLNLEVTVYAPEYRDERGRVRGYNGVLWRSPDEFDPLGDHGTVLFWRCPHVLPQVKDAPYQKLLWLHDAFYRAPPEAYEAADKVLVLSDAHAECIRVADGYDGDVHRVSNGIDVEQFDQLFDEDNAHRERYSVIYASSPDRGLERLLDMWRSLKLIVPQATLNAYYSWDGFIAKHPKDAERLLQKAEDLKDAGVTVHVKGVSQPELHRAFRRADVWAYPNSGIVETFCITAAKAAAAGAWPVVSNAGALHQTLGPWGDRPAVDDLNIDTAEGVRLFLNALVTRLQNPPLNLERNAMRRWAIDRYGWPTVAQEFAKLIRSAT